MAHGDRDRRPAELSWNAYDADIFVCTVVHMTRTRTLRARYSGMGLGGGLYVWVDVVWKGYDDVGNFPER